ncbi:MAG: hypothetical protein A2V69_02495 [Candidatus Portnoybacteria bacterium RBG_13_40_8]|uniref:TrbC/VIRB2 family protein n=1 Tax=Candidatus Portnoybacteria bacterium RBG_13_40_8 TaxID=1801990 RepID=A0A1G2F2P8_9BACT|nr:MAG: hypothetical protein A2V69_02495 [Candidatus Portnoybacteria bacterium RBG_13_40_8]OGZ34615.1 MAG: hypothetical protein A2V60_00550 [Candidatus Portnoybacteria bacterium RIFCSPHIGHO2_01_FULL_39_19]
MKKLFFIFIIFLLTLPVIVRAQIWITPDPCNSLESEGRPQATKLCDLIMDVALILYWLGVGLSILVVIVGGIMYMTAGSDESKVTNAKKIIMYGLIGAVIIFCASFIINLLQETVINRLLG